MTGFFALLLSIELNSKEEILIISFITPPLSLQQSMHILF